MINERIYWIEKVGGRGRKEGLWEVKEYVVGSKG
jgi:hypothetical protein